MSSGVTPSPRPQLPVVSLRPSFVPVTPTSSQYGIGFTSNSVNTGVPVYAQFANLITAAGTTFMKPGSSDLVTGAVEVLMPAPGNWLIGTISVAVVNAAGWGAATGSVDFTLRINGADTALKATLTAPGVAAFVLGTGQGVTSTDTISVKVSNNTLTQQAANPVVILGASQQCPADP